MAKQVSKTQTITVKTNEENPEPMELIANSIIEISDAFKKLGNSRLKKRVIVLLLFDMLKSRGVGINQIECVLDAAPMLEAYYIKQIQKGGK
jgi:hypothetical protein